MAMDNCNQPSVNPVFRAKKKLAELAVRRRRRSLCKLHSEIDESPGTCSPCPAYLVMPSYRYNDLLCASVSALLPVNARDRHQRQLDLITSSAHIKLAQATPHP